MRGFKSDSSKPISPTPAGESMSATAKPQPTMSSVGSANAQPSAPTPASPSAVIGPKIRFKGELVGEEDLLIQGQIDGTIDLKNHSLTIGGQGVVKADVLAKTVTIEGNIEGDLFGQERISILASSNVKGNIVAERVILEDGAKFRGSIDMDVEAHKDKFQNFTGTSAPSSAMAKPQAPAMDKPKTSDTE